MLLGAVAIAALVAVALARRTSIEGKALQTASTPLHLREVQIAAVRQGLPRASTPGQEMGRGGFEPPSVGL